MAEEETAIFKLYRNFHEQTIEKHGKNSVVFMMVGSFYELYAVSLDDVQIGYP
jgi:hypothetical protein